MGKNIILDIEEDYKADIVKEVSVLSDKRQMMIKLPKEICEYLKIKKGNKIKFIIEIPKDKKEKENLKFEVIK